MCKWLTFLILIFALSLFWGVTKAGASGSPNTMNVGGNGQQSGVSSTVGESLVRRESDYLVPPSLWRPFWGGGHRRNPPKQANCKPPQRTPMESGNEDSKINDEPHPVPRMVESSQDDLPQWIAQELAAVRLGDHRLDQRLNQLVDQFSRRPTASIPQASGKWKDTKGAYRFFDNKKTTHEKIIQGHRQSTLGRIDAGKMVLVLQDTTSLDYTSHPQTKGLGPLENVHRQGFFVHTAMAVSTEGVPLGLLGQQVWARDPKTVGKRHKRKKRPIEDKESYKWIEGLRASLEDVSARTCLVTVADRESDVFEFFSQAREQQTHILIRASWNRALKDGTDLLWDHVARFPFTGTYSLEVGRAKDRLPRLATLSVRFSPVTIQAPSRLRSRLQPVELNAIEVIEEKPPATQEPLHWLLLTSLPVESMQDAIRCARWYSLRWLIERFHFVLKSGCRIEQRELETADRLQTCLGVYAIVAWRLLWMTYNQRIQPDQPCTDVLKTHEWQSLYCYIHKTSVPPEQPPSVHQAMLWVAELGGFLGRKGDGQPGVKVLWLGWQRLQDIAQTWLIARSPPPLMGNA